MTTRSYWRWYTRQSLTIQIGLVYQLMTCADYAYMLNNGPKTGRTIRWTEAGDLPLPDGKFTCPRSVIGVDYEVLGLASDRRHCFSICFGPTFFCSLSRCRLRRRFVIRSPNRRITNRRSGRHRWRCLGELRLESLPLKRNFCSQGWLISRLFEV